LAAALLTVFVGGPGAAVNQIEDTKGKRFYKTAADHLKRNEFESDPAKRLKGVLRWPWFAQQKISLLTNRAGNETGAPPGELYLCVVLGGMSKI